ncbi:MAG: alpha-glucosidase, partial [Anaerolineae bacterium]|nr:alpha-glucosidase [Anaerolineae bacterium]
MEGAGGTHAEAHNIYGMQMVRATREGLEALQPERRPVVITRAGWAGVQRYATSWTGDSQSTWDALQLTIPMMLGLGLSGLGFSGPDVGGFAGAADGELFTRWIQMAAFMPFFRAHTAKGTPDQEPWSYGEPYLSIARRFIELRYELLPYLYTATWQMSRRGWPMVRPLAWEAPDSDALWDVDDAFLCGDKLLVAPMLGPGATNRDVFLPPGTWYEFWTNRRHTSDGAINKIEPFGSLEVMPLFVKAGTVLAMGEIGPSVEQRKDKFLRLNLYPLGGTGGAITELYEDAGTGMAYQYGEQRLSRFILHQTDTTISVTWEKSGAFVPPYEHIALTLCGLRRAPQTVKADGQSYAVLQADPVQHSAILGVPIFEELEIIL